MIEILTIVHDVVCKSVGTVATALLLVAGWCDRCRGPYDPFTT